MAELSFLVDHFSSTSPKLYTKRKASVRYYAKILLKGSKGETCQVLFVRPDGLQPFDPSLPDGFNPAKLAGVTYRSAYEYSWLMELLSSGRPLVVHLDSVHPLTNRVEPGSSPTPPFTPPPIPDVHGWITSTPGIGSALVWNDADGFRSYSSWTTAEKDALTAAFAKAWAQSATGLPNPPANIAESEFPNSGSILSSKDAFELYVAHVAQSLAVEIGERVDWSLLDYSLTDQMRILATNYMFWWDDAHGGNIVDGTVLPAPPDVGYRFLQQNALIRATRLETIAAILDWCRRNLVHSFVDGSWVNLSQAEQTVKSHATFWGYLGSYPASRILQGTVATLPSGWWWNHWTGGCACTVGFLKSLLRVVNIPSQRQIFNGGHESIEFTTEGRFLSHGDDPYSSDSKSTPDFPPVELFIDLATFDGWFDATLPISTIQSNVGRRAAQLAVDHLPDYLLHHHYLDKASQLPPEKSGVFGDLKKYYTLPELKTAQLWERLDKKLAAFKGIAMKKKSKGKPKAKKKPGPPYSPKRKKKTRAKPKPRPKGPRKRRR